MCHELYAHSEMSCCVFQVFYTYLVPSRKSERTHQIHLTRFYKRLVQLPLKIAPISQKLRGKKVGGLYSISLRPSIETDTGRTARRTATVCYMTCNALKANKRQQKKKDTMRQKNQRAKFKRKPSSTLPPAVWYPKEKKRRLVYEQHRKEVVEQKESVINTEEVTEYAQNNTDNDAKYKSKRNIKPSQRMIESNLYQQRRKSALHLHPRMMLLVFQIVRIMTFELNDLLFNLDSVSMDTTRQNSKQGCFLILKSLGHLHRIHMTM